MVPRPDGSVAFVTSLRSDGVVLIVGEFGRRLADVPLRSCGENHDRYEDGYPTSRLLGGRFSSPALILQLVADKQVGSAS